MKPVTEPILRAAANAFDFGGPVVYDARHYGEGHINDTFVVWREDHSKRFILQRINTDTFTDPVGLMENVCGVTRHLREKILAAGGDPARETLNVIPTLSGAACHLDAEGGAWRAYDFVEDTICLQQVGSEADFRTVAETLGKFQNQLADYPASTLHETIARFHDTPNRYANFEKALAADALGRAKDIAPEVAFIHAREKDCHTLLDLLAAGEIPLRVTHNDTKINNVLIDAATAAQIGLMDRLHQGDYQLIDRDTGKTPEEKQALMRQALTCGTFIMSSNAISADGQLVNMDGNANRVAALCFGPESVLVIAGMNKVMGDLDSAIARARQVAAPANAQRFDIKTPCAVTGSCGDCTSSDCICCQMVITRACRPAGRIKVILVGEDLGF